MSTESGRTLNSRPIVGSATLTMVTSMMFMNMAATKTAPTATFWLSWIRCTDQVTPKRPGGRRRSSSTFDLEPSEPLADSGGPKPAQVPGFGLVARVGLAVRSGLAGQAETGAPVDLFLRYFNGFCSYFDETLAAGFWVRFSPRVRF